MWKNNLEKNICEVRKSIWKWKWIFVSMEWILFRILSLTDNSTVKIWKFSGRINNLEKEESGRTVNGVWCVFTIRYVELQVIYMVYCGRGWKVKYETGVMYSNVLTMLISLHRIIVWVKNGWLRAYDVCVWSVRWVVMIGCKVYIHYSMSEVWIYVCVT